MYDVDGDNFVSRSELGLLVKTAMNFINNLATPSAEMVALSDMLKENEHQWWLQQKNAALAVAEAHAGRLSFDVFKQWASTNMRVAEFLRSSRSFCF